MRQPVAVARGQHYVQALAGVSRDLDAALARLEALASAPAPLAERTDPAALATLQYRLHCAAEALLAVDPPAVAEAEHDDLVDALVGARDATATVAAALAEDDEQLPGCIYEWRGALFRIRLARMALERDHEDERTELAKVRGRVVQALGFLCVALIAIGVGAHASAWIVVGAGLLGVALAVAALLRA